MAVRLRSLRPLIVVALATLPALAFAMKATPRAWAGDMTTDDTVKTGIPPASTTKTTSTSMGTELSTGPTTGPTLTPTPTPTGSTTGGATKPATSTSSASSSASSGSSSAAPSGSDSAAPPASASASGSMQPFIKQRVALDLADLAISFRVPSDWPKLADDDLPTVDTSADSEATQIARAGFGFHKPDKKPPNVAEVVVVCVKAPAEYWGDNIRDAAFTQMVSGVEKEAQQYTSLKSIEPDAIHNEGERLVQGYHAEAPFEAQGLADVEPAGTDLKKVPPPSVVHINGVSFIGFKQEGKGAPTLVACTVACAHLTTAQDKGVCSDVIGSLFIEGQYAAAPKRSWLAETLFALKRDKTTAWLLIIGAVVFLALIVVLVVALLRKKKPETAAAAAEDDDEPEAFDAGYQAGLAAARGVSPSGNASPSGGAPPSGGGIAGTVPFSPNGGIGSTSQPMSAPRSSGGAQPLAPTAPVPMGAGDPVAASPPPATGYFDPATLAPRT